MALARSETVVADNLVDRAMTGRHWYATAGENNSAKPWRDWCVLFAFGTACGMARCRRLAVRPEGADYQWRKIPPGELSIDPEADERLVRVTGRAEAS
jgi:hypothetical protein